MRCKYKSINTGSAIVREHTLIAEKALGRKLKDRECVHHIDGDKSNNSPENLVICPNDYYHMLLHRRHEALETSGNADYIKCQYCGKFDDPANITTSGKKKYHRYHKKCKNEYLRSYRRRKKNVSM